MRDFMVPLWLGIIVAGTVLYMAFRGTASACDTFCKDGQPDSCGKYSLSDAATMIAWAMAGFETATRDAFTPYDNSAWRGAAQTNNNPLNIRGINGQFNVYDSPAAGFAAGINDIEHKIMGFTVTGLGPSSTLADLVNIWSPQSCKGNAPGSTSNYVEFVVQQTGIDPSLPFSSYIEVTV